MEKVFECVNGVAAGAGVTCARCFLVVPMTCVLGAAGTEASGVGGLRWDGGGGGCGVLDVKLFSV